MSDKPIAFHVPLELDNELRRAAHISGTSKSALIRKLLREALDARRTRASE